MLRVESYVRMCTQYASYSVHVEVETYAMSPYMLVIGIDFATPKVGFVTLVTTCDL